MPLSHLRRMIVARVWRAIVMEAVVGLARAIVNALKDLVSGQSPPLIVSGPDKKFGSATIFV
jgi:hypothetical protein